MRSLTTATGDDDDILTLEPVTPERRPWWTPRTVRIAFYALGGAAILALIVAVLAIVLAPPSAVTILIVSLVALAIIVVGEIVLLLVAKPRSMG